MAGETHQPAVGRQDAGATTTTPPAGPVAGGTGSRRSLVPPASGRRVGRGLVRAVSAAL
ncbi:MAG TPA: hypothetical protein VF099_15010 [Ktedonobacterales bacterium]